MSGVGVYKEASHVDVAVDDLHKINKQWDVQATTELIHWEEGMQSKGGVTAHCRGVLNQRSRASTAAERGPVGQLLPSLPWPSSAEAAALPHTSKRAHPVQPALAAWCK